VQPGQRDQSPGQRTGVKCRVVDPAPAAGSSSAATSRPSLSVRTTSPGRGGLGGTAPGQLGRIGARRRPAGDARRRSARRPRSRECTTPDPRSRRGSPGQHQVWRRAEGAECGERDDHRRVPRPPRTPPSGRLPATSSHSAMPRSTCPQRDPARYRSTTRSTGRYRDQPPRTLRPAARTSAPSPGGRSPSSLVTSTRRTVSCGPVRGGATPPGPRRPAPRSARAAGRRPPP